MLIVLRRSESGNTALHYAYKSGEDLVLRAHFNHTFITQHHTFMCAYASNITHMFTTQNVHLEIH